ncbi:MAG: hypothetical protein Q9165_002205 [Trypethelium subeluteriae]
MAVPFGISVGDFIVFIETTIKVVNALHHSKGARKEYEGVSRELESLKLALNGVQGIETNDPQIKAALELIATNCWRTIREFLDKTQKYDLSLGSATHSRRKWKDGLRKIQWALYSEEEVQKFRWQLYSYTGSLIVLLGALGQGTAAEAQREQCNALLRIETKMNADRRQAAASQAMIVSTILRCWKEFRLMVALILPTNFRIFGLVANFSKLSSQVSFEQPVTFQDAHGRMLPIQVAWIDTWDHFETMLKWKFSTLPGLAKIERGEYVLTDPFGTKDIDRARSIHRLKTFLAAGNENNTTPDFEYLLFLESKMHGPLPKRKINTDTDIVSDFSRVRILELEDQQPEKCEETGTESSIDEDENGGEDTEDQDNGSDMETTKEIKITKPIIPIYPKIHREYVVEDTLLYYDLPYEIDHTNSDYIIILREMDRHEMDVLFQHTRRFRTARPYDRS